MEAKLATWSGSIWSRLPVRWWSASTNWVGLGRVDAFKSVTLPQPALRTDARVSRHPALHKFVQPGYATDQENSLPPLARIPISVSQHHVKSAARS